MRKSNKKKKLNRSKLIAVFSCVFVGVIGITIAYAALSTTLNISGSAEVNGAEWGLKIDKLKISELDVDVDAECSKEGVYCHDNYVTFGGAELVSEPSIVGTSINNFEVSIVKPGDIVLLYYKITNNGTIPAKLVSKEYNTPEIVSVSNNPDDVLWAENNFIYGDDIGKTNVGDMQIGDVICPGDTQELVLIVMINENADSLPSGKINVSNLGSNYVFSQAENNTCPA